MIYLKEAEDPDLPEIAELASKIWWDFYTPLLSDAQIRYMLERFYSEASLIRQTREGQHYFFIMHEMEKIGFVSFSQTGSHDFFIHKLYILTSEQRKKAGSSVISILEEMFCKRTDHAPYRIRLTVNRQNYTSVNFYFRNGFTIEKVEDIDIGEGYFMNDFIMVRHTVCKQGNG